MTTALYELARSLAPEAWVAKAKCAGYPAEWWWPVSNEALTEDHERALKICSRCPVIRSCGEWALDNHMTSGIWGGMRPDALERLVRGARRALPVVPYVEPTPVCQRCKRHPQRSLGLCRSCHSYERKCGDLSQYPKPEVLA